MHDLNPSARAAPGVAAIAVLGGIVLLGNGLKAMISSSVLVSEPQFAAFLGIAVERVAVLLEAIVAGMVIALAGYPLLYLPTHIVWLELIIHPTALLVFQDLTSPDDVPARAPTARFFSGREWTAVGVVGATLTALVTGAWLWGLADEGEAHGRKEHPITLVRIAYGLD